ncbi:MAG: sigma-70 family RNA polymerase sigma factor [Synechococcaceae cyanobacterium]|nr:sigma-70 family RNA polymerase sigma factor [Synechococcaceae cyanobacterium]
MVQPATRQAEPAPPPTTPSAAASRSGGSGRCGRRRQAPTDSLTRPAQAQASSIPPAAAAPEARLQHNQQWLEAYCRLRHTEAAIPLRNRLVQHNLPLVRKVAGDLRQRLPLPFEDMVQIGSLGLIRAIEAWDGRPGARLSSFAVPYIRGAIQRELRDRQSLLRIPRPLWDLRQRAQTLQEQRRRQGLSPLRAAALAAALDCTAAQLEEALQLEWTTSVRSLDAPRPGPEPGSGGTLLDLVADPASLEPPREEPLSPELGWLRARLLRLDPASRLLLERRVLQGLSWRELGRPCGMGPIQARRHVETALEQLRRAACEWQGDQEPEGALQAAVG